MKKTKTIKYVSFRNPVHGGIISLPAKMTAEEMVASGIVVNMSPPHVPVKQNEFVHTPEKKKTK
jgi:hypothetical protein